ncbi:MAG: DNA polymerase III subunit delta' [Candidatus Aminicenantes bacterium]|nr:DNA polymerase III subunit delta' [Candidatus Aminicenantes bacterium]
MSFQNIIGNSRVKMILSKALKRDRVPHSLFFVGPEGVGKMATALVVAKALNCLQKFDDSCEECPACVAINKKNFPDVMEILPDKNVIKIEQMRDLKSAAYFKPMVGKKRVFIIPDAEIMNEQASNSFLKILEEPPSFSHMILLTDNPYLILPTIKSRCQILSFAPVFKEDIEKVLLGKGYEAQQARIISLVVRGNLKYALNLDWEDLQENRKKAWQVLFSLIRKENASVFLKEFSSSRFTDRQEIKKIFDFLSSFCRDIVLFKEEGDLSHIMNPDYEQDLREISRLLSLDQALDFLNKIDYSLYALQKNLNVNLLMSSLFSHFMEKHYV